MIPLPQIIERAAARALDFGMCVAMNNLQRRHRLNPGSLVELQTYISEGEALTRAEYYATPNAKNRASEIESGDFLSRPSPVRTAFPKNDCTHVDLFPCDRGPSAPTVFLLHALMSTSDRGYRKWARAFNHRGWNACFVHLPFHYSRTPIGYRNGELAISADLVRTAEGLRQGVIELRELMQTLRARGCSKFGLWASSYGAWIGALLSFVEPGFRFIALMEPIVNVDHAIWTCPAARQTRAELKRAGIQQELVSRHFHLTSPMHGIPLDGGDRVILAGGEYDLIALLADIETLHRKWPGSELIRIRQGHFGYRMMPAVFERLVQRGWI